MDVQPLGHFRVGFAGHCPLAVVELVPAVVHRDDVHHEDVLRLLVQSFQADFEGREHSPAREREREREREGTNE